MAKDSYEKLLDAAEEIVFEVGASHVTLDAVAKKAGMSKGGLIYNFPTKEHLLQAMLTRFTQQGQDAMEREKEKLPAQPGRDIKAYLLALLNRNPRDMQIGAGFVAAVAHDPQMIKPAKDACKETLDAIISGPHETRMKVLALAAHGILFMELLAMFPFDAKEKQEIIAELLRMVDEEPL